MTAFHELKSKKEDDEPRAFRPSFKKLADEYLDFTQKSKSERTYKQGSSPASYDKQFVRDHLERVGWNKQPPVPALPDEVAEGTARRYNEFLQKLVNK